MISLSWTMRLSSWIKAGETHTTMSTLHRKTPDVQSGLDNGVQRNGGGAGDVLSLRISESLR